MDAEARARANVPRPGNKQPLTGLDPYHRLLREAHGDSDRPYAATKGSFSVPRPLPSLLFGGPSPDGNESSPSVDLGTFPVPPGNRNKPTAPSAAEWFGSGKKSRSPFGYSSASPGLTSPTPQEGEWFGSSRNQSRLTSSSPADVKNPTTKPLPKTPPKSLISKFSGDSTSEAILPWRPLYLRRRVLLFFAVLFLLLIVALEVILLVSNRNNGLAKSGRAIRYVWQYGVTFFFVLIAAIWTRVEYQARATAPWIRMSSRPADVDNTLLLDYISMFQPLVTIKAIQNRDLLVAASGSVGIALRALVLLATTLATPRIDGISSTVLESTVVTRILVRPIPTHLMVAFLAICLVLTIFAIFLAPGHGFLPRNPGTLIGMAAMVAHSHPLLELLQGMGGATTQGLRERLGGSTYYTGVEGYNATQESTLGYFKIYGGEAPEARRSSRSVDPNNWCRPVVLRGIIRLLVAMLFALVILGLEICLRISEQNDGLETVDSESYIYLLWTLLPALLMLLLIIYVDVVDFWTRIMAPFRQLARQGGFGDSMNVNLMDAWRPAALWRAYQIRDTAVIMTLLGGFSAMLLVVASAALFQATPVRSTSNVFLSSQDFFANNLASSPEDTICTDCTNDATTASSILQRNASYPPFTFADLNLPTVELFDGVAANDDLRVAIKVPAIRSNLTCRLYQPGEILTNLTVGYTMDGEIVNPLRIDVQGEPCRGTTERRASNAVIGTAASSTISGTDVDDNAFFGTGIARSNTTAQCSDWLYVWGQLANANTNRTSLRTIMAMTCNETIEAVDTTVIFHGTDLKIDPEDPPVPDESTAFNTTVAIPELDYSLLAKTSTSNLFDPFFGMLSTSNSSIPATLFGNSSVAAGKEVEEAIKRQHNIIRAQSLNFKTRRHLTLSKTFPTINGVEIRSGVDPDASASEAVPTVTGTAILLPVRLRQEVVATRLLQSVLGAVLLFHILSWVSLSRVVLPRPPTTIAAVAALLADGNIFQYLPPVAEWQPIADLASLFRDGNLAMAFKLGWETVHDSDRKHRGRERRARSVYGIRVHRGEGWRNGEAGIEMGQNMKSTKR